jgi:hypothetical protein
VSDEKGPRPAVFARLRHDQEARTPDRAPPGWSRWLGILLIVAIVVAVAIAVIQAPP